MQIMCIFIYIYIYVYHPYQLQAGELVTTLKDRCVPPVYVNHWYEHVKTV